ncbi:hypothetical protein [Sphingomonas hylomeconis]|uniref:Uncharacterized protein n=1 Tax=Sphingomonas hylomeconis TaxID=1395958 RepID=A0ABV7SNZ7_9SPHN|nr:hypothetical protein [Sphingomonas hylomeconis]
MRPRFRLTALAAAASILTANTAPGGESEPAAVLPLDALRVPVLDAGRLEGTLLVQADLELGASSDASRVPAYRAALLSAALEFARLRVSPNAPVDVQLLSEALTMSVRSVDPQIRHVLIVEVTARSVR